MSSPTAATDVVDTPGARFRPRPGPEQVRRAPADQQRSDEERQAIEKASVRRAPARVGPPSKSTSGGRGWVSAARPAPQTAFTADLDSCAPPPRPPARGEAGATVKRSGRPGAPAKDLRAGGRLPLAGHDDPSGVAALAKPHGQHRVVAAQGAGANDGVGLSAHDDAPGEALLAAPDPARLAVRRRPCRPAILPPCRSPRAGHSSET